MRLHRLQHCRNKARVKNQYKLWEEQQHKPYRGHRVLRSPPGYVSPTERREVNSGAAICRNPWWNQDGCTLWGETYLDIISSFRILFGSIPSPGRIWDPRAVELSSCTCSNTIPRQFSARRIKLCTRCSRCIYWDHPSAWSCPRHGGRHTDRSR